MESEGPLEEYPMWLKLFVMLHSTVAEYIIHEPMTDDYAYILPRRREEQRKSNDVSPR